MTNKVQLRVFKDDPIEYKVLNKDMTQSEGTVDLNEERAEKSVFKAYLW